MKLLMLKGTQVWSAPSLETFKKIKERIDVLTEKLLESEKRVLHN